MLVSPPCSLGICAQVFMQERQAFRLPWGCGAEQEPGLHLASPLPGCLQQVALLPPPASLREELRSQRISEVPVNRIFHDSHSTSSSHCFIEGPRKGKRSWVQQPTGKRRHSVPSVLSPKDPESVSGKGWNECSLASPMCQAPFKHLTKESMH